MTMILGDIAIGIAIRLIIMTVGLSIVKMKYLPQLPSIVGPVVFFYYLILVPNDPNIEFADNAWCMLGLFFAENVRMYRYLVNLTNSVGDTKQVAMTKEAAKKPKRVHKISGDKVQWSEKPSTRST